MPKHPPLTPAQQQELITKIRYGIGIDELLAGIDEDEHPPHHEPPRVEAQRRAVALLGRGHRLGRSWR